MKYLFLSIPCFFLGWYGSEFTRIIPRLHPAASVVDIVAEYTAPLDSAVTSEIRQLDEVDKVVTEAEREVTKLEIALAQIK